MLDDLLEEYSPYRIATLGCRYIKPIDIIGFSLSEQKILDSGKLEYLKERVQQNGWQPIHVSDFELILFPNQKYSVGNGGNHRAYLSKLLGIESVLAHIEILIPERKISEYTKSKIEQYEEEIKLFSKNAKELKRLDEPTKKQMDELEKNYNLQDLKHETINQLLLIEAKNLGYLSNELLLGN